MSDWLETSRDILRVCWYLEVARRGTVGRASPARSALFAPWLGTLTNPLDTIPLNDLDSGKNIPGIVNESPGSYSSLTLGLVQ